MSKKVPVQKGSIDPNPMTMKQMTHPQKVAQAREEQALRRSGQTMTLHEPRSSKK
jgi:hypothetical protein